MKVNINELSVTIKFWIEKEEFFDLKEVLLKVPEHKAIDIVFGKEFKLSQEYFVVLECARDSLENCELIEVFGRNRASRIEVDGKAQFWDSGMQNSGYTRGCDKVYITEVPFSLDLRDVYPFEFWEKREELVTKAIEDELENIEKRALEKANRQKE